MGQIELIPKQKPIFAKACQLLEAIRSTPAGCKLQYLDSSNWVELKHCLLEGVSVQKLVSMILALKSKDRFGL